MYEQQSKIGDCLYKNGGSVSCIDYDIFIMLFGTLIFPHLRL